jgi:hypothetical protein
MIIEEGGGGWGVVWGWRKFMKFPVENPPTNMHCISRKHIWIYYVAGKCTGDLESNTFFASGINKYVCFLSQKLMVFTLQNFRPYPYSTADEDPAIGKKIFLRTVIGSICICTGGLFQMKDYGVDL